MAAHRQRPLKEPHAVHRQAEALAGAQPRPSGQDDERPQLCRYGVADRRHLTGGQGNDRLVPFLGSFVPSRGCDASRRSLTAAFITEATMPCTTPVVAGANSRPATLA